MYMETYPATIGDSKEQKQSKWPSVVGEELNKMWQIRNMKHYTAV